MTILDRYIARTFLGGYALLVLVGMGMYVLSDLLVNLDEFTENRSLSGGQVVSLIIDYYGNNLPLFFSQLSGPMMTIAAGFTLGMMLRNNEMTALLSAGMPLQRLTVPLVICSVLIVGLWMVNREVLIPSLATKIARTRDDVVGTRSIGVYCARDDRNAILTALRLDPRAGVLTRVFIIEPDSQGRPAHVIEADTATYDARSRTWRLERGRRLLLSDPMGAKGLGQPIRFESVDAYPYTLTPAELVLRQGSEWSELLSISQLNTLLQSRQLPNRGAIEMSRHVRLTQPLLQWIMLLLAVPFFLTREPANVLAAGGKALLMTGAFFGLAFLAQSVSKDDVWAALTAWIPILIFGPIAVLQLANAKT